jgi:hypothetical protein
MHGPPGKECTFNRLGALSSSTGFKRGGAGFPETLAISQRQTPIMTSVRLLALAAAVSWVAIATANPQDTVTPPPVPPPAKAPKEVVWEAHLPSFEQPDYDRAVNELLDAYERALGRRLAPGFRLVGGRVTNRVGLKVYTDSGPGLETPVPLVKAVINALVRRGYANDNIFLVGLNQLRLRMTGYLPSLVTGKTPFEGNPVYVLESRRYYSPVFYYESPLPERFDPVFAAQQIQGVPNASTKDEDRKSFLATPLFLNADFWINLPVYTDHQVLGVNGALGNGTLWNASNTARFFRSPANAPAAVAEMSAIPELRETWLCTISSLQIYQFIGGPFFNSLYTRSEPLVWLSDDPVIMDALMRARMNLWRKREGFEDISEDIRTLEFAEMLGVGSTRIKNTVMIPVGKW